MKSSVRAKVKRSITQLFHSLTTIQSVHRMKEEASKQNPSNWVCRDYVLLHICQWTESCVSKSPAPPATWNFRSSNFHMPWFCSLSRSLVIQWLMLKIHTSTVWEFAVILRNRLSLAWITCPHVFGDLFLNVFGESDVYTPGWRITPRSELFLSDWNLVSRGNGPWTSNEAFVTCTVTSHESMLQRFRTF